MAKLSSIQDAEQLYAATSILPYASIEELDLSSLQLPSAEQWDTLLEACSRCTGLRVLSIKGCNIGAHGAYTAGVCTRCCWRHLRGCQAGFGGNRVISSSSSCRRRCR